MGGELRFNMVNDVCLGVIHKVPAPGGMSAVGGTGSVYKFYDNNTLSPDGSLKDGIDGFVKTGVKETFFVNKEKSADGNRHRVAPEDGPKKVEEGVCVEETITVDLQSLLDKFVKEDCPKLMATLELPDEPIPLWWTADFINGSKGECWKPAEGAAKWVVEGHPCWRSGRRNNVWQHRRKGGRKDAGCCLSLSGQCERAALTNSSEVDIAGMIHQMFVALVFRANTCGTQPALSDVDLSILVARR